MNKIKNKWRTLLENFIETRCTKQYIETFGNTDLGDFNDVSALGDIDTLNNTLPSLAYDPGEHSEYKQTESDGDILLEIL